MTDYQDTVPALRETNPYLTLKDIGAKVGITGEAVRKILKVKGLPTKALRHHRQCLNCGTATKGKRVFCSSSCRYYYVRVQVECTWCHKLFWTKKSERQRNNLSFCSRTCHGKWLGNQHGFTTRPEDRRYGTESKYQFMLRTLKNSKLTKRGELRKKLLETGIPLGSYGMIKKMLAELK